MGLTSEAHRFLRLGFSEGEISRMKLTDDTRTRDDVHLLIRVLELLLCVIDGDQQLLEHSGVPELVARAREIDELCDGAVDAAKKIVAFDKEMITEQTQ